MALQLVIDILNWYVLELQLDGDQLYRSGLCHFFGFVFLGGDKDDTIIDAIYFLKEKFC
jgi:hypothetical protein